VPHPPRFIVHSSAEAEAALRAGADARTAIVLESPPDAARSWGAPFFLALVAQASAAVPDASAEAVLDCGAAPGLAMEALRRGVKTVRLRDSEDMVARVADIAAQLGARVETGPYPAALDLSLSRGPYRAARQCLAAAE
jgi:predicted nicotinamide N-methyase